MVTIRSLDCVPIKLILFYFISFHVSFSPTFENQIMTLLLKDYEPNVVGTRMDNGLVYRVYISQTFFLYNHSYIYSVRWFFRGVRFLRVHDFHILSLLLCGLFY